MQFTNGRSRRVALDMTPLIDVVLMLVIFFMLTTTFVLSPGIEVDLPRGHSTQEPRERDAIITMTKAGVIYYQDAQVSLATLQSVLRARTCQPMCGDQSGYLATRKCRRRHGILPHLGIDRLCPPPPKWPINDRGAPCIATSC